MNEFQKLSQANPILSWLKRMVANKLNRFIVGLSVGAGLIMSLLSFFAPNIIPPQKTEEIITMPILFGVISLIMIRIVPLVILSPLLLLSYLVGFIPKPKCKICQRETSGELIYEDGKSREGLCHEHLCQRLQSGLHEFNYKNVVIHPVLADSEIPFRFSPLSNMDTNDFSNEDKNKLKEIIDSINGKCENCDQEAKVAYFGAPTPRLRDNNNSIVKITNKPKTLLCKNCLLDKIMPHFLRKTVVIDGETLNIHYEIVMPFSSEGIMMPDFSY